MTTRAIGHDPAAQHEHDVSQSQFVGVVLLIVADAAFVLSLAFTYFYLRGLNTDNHWIPPGSPTIPPTSGWVIAAVMVASAAAYWWGAQGMKAGDTRRLAVGTGLALALLAADFVIQVIRLMTLPFLASTGSYASSVITFAGAHLVHLLLTAFLGIAVWNRARKGRYTQDAHVQVRLVGFWWGWVAISAVLIAFATSFVASPHVVG